VRYELGRLEVRIEIEESEEKEWGSNGVRPLFKI
jgi:hypothetical protein